MTGVTNEFKFQFEEVSFEVGLAAHEKVISTELARSRSWESHQLRLYSRLIGESGIFVDVGANVGINSIFAKLKKPNARILAIEPNPQNFHLLCENSRKALL